MTDSPPALEFSGVEKSYDRILALRGLSFAVQPGEFVGLLGPNGSGKSTLFRIAAGLFGPDKGSVALFGRSYRDDPSQILRRLGVVFQARSVDMDMTVTANLKFHGALFGLSGQQLRQRIAEVTELLEITDIAGTMVRNLSGGQQRRVEIARALLNQPELLLMDEPTVGLDMQTRRVLRNHVQSLQRRMNVAVLWATHLVDEAEVADRIVLIAGGRVAATGTPAELCAEAGAPSLSEAYLTLGGAVATD